MKKGYKTILSGIVGSRAYNLDTEDSDIDMKGICVAPTMDFFKHGGSKDVTTVSADETYYELQKFIQMVSKGNPTALELLYLQKYTTMLWAGSMLVNMRKFFLTSNVRYTYGGYSRGQFQEAKELEELSPKYQKKVRHAFRLLIHGTQILKTGDLTVRLSDEDRVRLFSLGTMPMSELVEKYKREEEVLMSVETALPIEPDYGMIDDTVIYIRKNFERV